MNVRHEQPHRPALSNLPSLVQILLRALGPVRAPVRKRSQARVRRPRGNIVSCTGAAETVHGMRRSELRWQGSNARSIQDRFVERGAAQREMVEGDVEKRGLRGRVAHSSVCAARSETARQS